MMQNGKKMQGNKLLMRLFLSLLLVGAIAVLPAEKAHASGVIKGLGKYLGGVFQGQAQSYAEDAVRNQIPGQQQNQTVGNPIQYVTNNLSPKDTVQTLTQDNGYRHSSMEFTYKTAAADSYMGQFVPGGDSAINSGNIKAAMENQYIKDMLNNPELDHLPGLNSADTMVDYTNKTTFDGFNFYLNLDQNPDYKDVHGFKRFAYLTGDTICGTFINIENGAKSFGKSWNQFWNSMNHQSDTDSNHQTWVVRFLADPTNSKGNTSQGAKVDSATGAKKPNIYLYGEEGLNVEVAFSRPELLTAADPDYPFKGWKVSLTGGRMTLLDGKDAAQEYFLQGTYGLGGDTCAPDGTIGYLFYESAVDESLFQFDEAFVITADERWEKLYRLMTVYGFNEAETLDFADFWDDYLRDDMDYLFYPQLTECVDAQMPLKVMPTPEHVFRLWFVVKEVDSSNAADGRIATPEITERAVHDGFALTEWGIVFAKEEEFEACR